MKYLYLLIRHIFPRKRWKLVHEKHMYLERNPAVMYAIIKEYEDQFGNAKVIKIKV